MTYAQIQDGKVVNVIIADADFIAALPNSGDFVAYDIAGIGWNYDGTQFYPPQPFPSWTLDDNHDWQAPVPYPTDDKFYTWSEDKLNWIEVGND